MEGIRLRNIRSLRDTGDLEFKPLTLLIGKNSSGKSSVARSLPLISQSLLTRSNAPLLWYGDFVDFGSVSDVKMIGSEEDFVEIDILLTGSARDAYVGYYSPFAREAERIWVSVVR